MGGAAAPLRLRRAAGIICGQMAPAPPNAGLPIAVFDSGVGGLTVLHECLVSLPEEDYVYLGDDARFPYGARSTAELREHVEQVTGFLLERGAKLLVIACNSAASAGNEVAREIAAEAGIETVAVIDPEAEIAAALTQTGQVGVLATPATVRSGSYLRTLSHQHRALTVTEVEAPDLAAVIQRGFPFDEGVVEMVRSYCEPLKRAEVDTVILGCTHYPLVAPMLQRVLGRDVRLVTAGHAIAATVQRVLDEVGLATDSDREGTYRFLCTGDPEAFRELGTRFLQMPLGDVERVELP
jgi:glutamate racemase